MQIRPPPYIDHMHLQQKELEQDAHNFWEYGFVILRGVFLPAEMENLKKAINQSQRMQSHIDAVRRGNPENHGAFETIFVWNDTGGNDIFAKATRNYKILDRLRYFFKDDVYVYHNKVALKYPGIRGFQYHQDYAYWYNMGNLYPDMATAQIAVDDCTIDNGCLRVLAGSHKLGRVQHGFDSGSNDNGVEKERLAEVQGRLQEVVAELKAGDVIIFHCNTFHASRDNASDQSRLTLLGCYNTKHNSPTTAKDSGHPYYSHQPSLYGQITEYCVGDMPDFDLRYE